MRRDRMRMFAWLLVWLGVAIWALVVVTVPARQINYEKSMELWKVIISLQRQTVQWGGGPVAYEPPPTPPGTVSAAGFIVGAIVLGFGVLLLAIRRPERQAERAMPRPQPWLSGPIGNIRTAVAKIISGPAHGPPTKIRDTWIRPPWEKDDPSKKEPPHE